jgi:hypothetical protein
MTRCQSCQICQKTECSREGRSFDRFGTFDKGGEMRRSAKRTTNAAVGFRADWT